MPVPLLHTLAKPVRAAGHAIVRAVNSKYMSPAGDTDETGLTAGPAPFGILRITLPDPMQSGLFFNVPGLAASIAADLGTTASSACVAAGEADPDGDPYDNDCSGDHSDDPD